MYPLRVETLPEGLTFLPWSEVEMARTPLPNVFIRRSEPVWVLTDDDNHTYAVIGVITPTIASIPEAWILLCEPFKRNLRKGMIALRDSMDEMLEYHPHVQVKVDAETPCGRKLVEFLGFKEYYHDYLGGREFIYYEARK